ncbi:MAG: plasmid recombination protein [Mycoplasmatales bacterium]|nr:plasmid recombination protein [Mycoplasmatales bacterium]
MKLTFDFKSASRGQALGIANHNARVKGHYESRLTKPGLIGGIRQEDIKNNIELTPIQSFDEKDWIGGRKIVGGRQSLARKNEFTTWMIQAGGINNKEKKLDTLPLKENIKFLKDAHKWLEQKFGKVNIKSSHIHLDETTPQLQVVMSNIVEREDGKIYLGKKRTFGYQGLTELQIKMKAKALQQEFHKDVASKYGIEEQDKKLGDKGKLGQASWLLQLKEQELKEIKETLSQNEADVKLFEAFASKNKDAKAIGLKMVKALEKYNPELAKAAKAALVKKTKENIKDR